MRWGFAHHWPIIASALVYLVNCQKCGVLCLGDQPLSPTLFLLRHEIPEEIPVLKGWLFQYSERKGNGPIVSRLSSLPPGWSHCSIWAAITRCLRSNLNRNWLSLIKVSADSVFGRASLPFDRQYLLDVPLDARKGETTPYTSFLYKDVLLIHTSPNTLT